MPPVARWTRGCPSWTLIEPCASPRSLNLEKSWNRFGHCCPPHKTVSLGVAEHFDRAYPLLVPRWNDGLRQADVAESPIRISPDACSGRRDRWRGQTFWLDGKYA